MKDPPPELCFGRIIYIDCSTWESQRMMQRKISDELKLDQKTMDMFQEQDEEDDFNGVDHASRDVIPSVAAVIDKTLRESTFMMILINGSDDELELRRFGIPEYHDYIILWTFGRRFNTMSYPTKIVSSKLRYTDVFMFCSTQACHLSTSQFVALFREEAAAGNPYMREMDLLTIVVECWLYGLLLYQSFCSTIGFAWPSHATNYWICDGIIQGDQAHHITNALNPQKNFERDAYLHGVFENFEKHPNTPFLVVTDADDDVYKKRSYYRWISVTLKNKKVHEGMQTLFARASSIFLAFENGRHNPHTLPSRLFKQCTNLGVLVLSCCAFNFLSPPFIHCHTLRFLGLDHCMDDNNAVDEEGGDYAAIRWVFLKSLWVIDLYYTNWVEILSEDKMCLMDNLMELNIRGVRCSQFISQLQKRLPCIQRLRIIKPMDEASSIDIADSLTNKRNLEILDLSGNTYMKSLPTSISMAIHLQVLILDGCDELENVVVPNGLPSSLRSFSFDGYGPASHRPSTIVLPPESCRPKHLPYFDKKDVKTSMISLEGCRQLDNLFLRGLLNLVELDLSGCAIKVLDFETMVVGVPMLKRLFLLGCERLRAINWGSDEKRVKRLMSSMELVCIDTRSSRSALGCDRPSLDTLPRSFQLHMHVTTADARLLRSLFDLIQFAKDDVCFSINITSSTPCSGAVVQPEETTRKMMETTNDQEHHVVVGLYGDIFTEVSNGMNQMQAFPQPPTRQLDHHIEIGDGSHAVQSEMDVNYYEYGKVTIAMLMTEYAQSLHVHDVRNCSNTMPTKANTWYHLRWCRVERCPDLQVIFPTNTDELLGKLKIIWASDLLMARCVWSKGHVEFDYGNRFKGLQHLHLRCCPSLRFAVAMGGRPSFPSLETLHIIHCGDLRHIFVPGNEEIRHTSIQFPKLTTIHLHDLPSLQQICEAAEMVAPAVETIRIRGCPNLRRLPAIRGREAGMRMPTVEVEKDVWDVLEWDGVDAGHHPSLYEKPLHSRYYKQSRLLRRTVLRYACAAHMFIHISYIYQMKSITP
jgi:hypothetical protein